MSYKRILYGFGILNSFLLIFAIFFFFHNQEQIPSPSSIPLSSEYANAFANNGYSLHATMAGTPEDVTLNSFVFLFASSLSLIPFLFFFTIVNKKFKKYKRREIELLHVNKNKDLFFSIISHDLKSPAENLIALSELNLKYVQTPEEIANINSLIYKSSKKHYELLTNLLDWSKTQFTQSHLIKGACSLKQVVDMNISMQMEKIKEKNLLVCNHIHESLSLQTNENMVSTIIRNLLNNAIKFTPANGKISFYEKTTRKNVQLFIEDNGRGMSAHTLKNLFDIKYIRSLRGTNKEVGSGIGLMICKEIAEKLDGEIRVKSKERQGTVFILSLPHKL